MNIKIPISKTVFNKEDFEIIKKPLESGWVLQGKYVTQFENMWSSFTGADHSIAVSSCSTALHLTLSALGIKKGDEVIVPSFTWVATANAVESCGAKTIFCDIDTTTYNISIQSLKKIKGNNIKAIVPVHMFGLAADMDKVIDHAGDRNLLIIEDAACGFGSKYNGHHVGLFSHAGCFSFHPRKAITTGEGGMITTDDLNFSEKLRSMRDHGAVVSDYHMHGRARPYLLAEYPYLGYNYRMTDIQASIGCSQMERAEQILNSRKKIAKKYDKLIDTIPWLMRTRPGKKYEHAYQAYVCMFSPEEINNQNVLRINKQRNLFMDYLLKKGIMTRPGTHAVHMLEYYSKKYNIKPTDYPNAFAAYMCSIAFPIFPGLNDSEFEYIAESISSYKLKYR